MSFLNNLFHRKNQTEDLDLTMDEDTFSESQEEDESTGTDGREAFKNSSEENDPETEKEYEVVEREILPAKIICPDCGGITLEGLEFCDKCGGELL